MKIRPITASAARRWLPKYPPSINKGDRGRLYIVAGSRGMVGAGVLAALGAARSGAGLTRLATVSSQQTVAARRAPLEVTTQALPEDRSGHLSRAAAGAIRRALRSFAPTVLAAGPGLGQTPAVRSVVRALLSEPLPLVLDADGLNALAVTGLTKRAAPLVITPHPGELSRLLGWSVKKIQSDRPRAAIEGARRFNAVCLLKGAGTLVTDGREIWRNTTGNPGMASGGMGDVLTGIIAALWGQMPRRDAAAGFAAARLGAFIHGLAGDLAARKIGRQSLLASDLAGFLSSAFRAV